MCRDYVQRLHDDRVPVSYYRDKAIEWNVHLFAGVGSSQIDRNGISDMATTKEALQKVASKDVEAVNTVAPTIRNAGYSNREQAWPGTIYFEDVSSGTQRVLP